MNQYPNLNPFLSQPNEKVSFNCSKVIQNNDEAQIYMGTLENSNEDHIMKVYRKSSYPIFMKESLILSHIHNLEKH